MNRLSKEKWTIATAALLLALGGAAAAQQTDAPAAADHSGHDHGGDAQSGAGHGGMGRGGMGGMGGMSGMGGMNHGGMGQGGGMGCMGGMSHGDAAKGADAGGRSEGHEKHGGGMMKHLCGVGEHIDGRLAYLKAELKLTDAQAPQWNAFADAYRAAGQKVGQYCAAMMKDHKMPSGVVEHLGMMERNMTAHLDSVRAIKAAAEPLFAVLSDEQKKAAEETMTEIMQLGMGGMGKH